MEYLPINMTIYPVQLNYEYFIYTLVDLSYGTGIDFLQVLGLDEKYCKLNENCDNGGDNLIDKIDNEKESNYWLIVSVIITIITIVILILLVIFQSYYYKRIVLQYQYDKAITK